MGGLLDTIEKGIKIGLVVGAVTLGLDWGGQCEIKYLPNPEYEEIRNDPYGYWFYEVGKIPAHLFNGALYGGVAGLIIGGLSRKRKKE